MKFSAVDNRMAISVNLTFLQAGKQMYLSLVQIFGSVLRESQKHRGDSAFIPTVQSLGHLSQKFTCVLSDKTLKKKKNLLSKQGPVSFQWYQIPLRG